MQYIRLDECRKCHMPAPIKVSLSKEEDQHLLNLQQHHETPPRVRYRAEIVLLNAYGWSVSQIADD
jgi:hypothetical protein